MENKIEQVSEIQSEIQGDEETLDTIFNHLTNNFPRLQFKLKIPLKELFPEPKNRYLKSFWGNNSHADISVFRHQKLVCIIEPGGYHHFKDEKTRIRDQKKDIICHTNGVHCLRVANSIIKDLDLKVTRKLLKKYFYSENGLGGM